MDWWQLHRRRHLLGAWGPAHQNKGRAVLQEGAPREVALPGPRKGLVAVGSEPWGWLGWLGKWPLPRPRPDSGSQVSEGRAPRGQSLPHLGSPAFGPTPSPLPAALLWLCFCRMVAALGPHLPSSALSLQKFDELLRLASRGQHANVDMLVQDIYGGAHQTLGLSGNLIASSFGKSATADRGTALAISRLPRLGVRALPAGHSLCSSSPRVLQGGHGQEPAAHDQQ